MWKNPNSILGVIAPFIVRRLVEAEFPLKAVIDPLFETNPMAHTLIRQMLNRWHDGWQDAESNERLVRRELLALAREVEVRKEWQLVPGIWRVADDYEGRLSVQLTGALSGIAQAIHYLVGSENRHLVGTRQNQPAWKPRDVRRKTPLQILQGFPIDSDVEYLDGNDLDLVPDDSQWMLEDQLPMFPVFNNPWEKIGSLLEDAYYNQQYLPHPDGSFVKLRGVPGLDGVTIKTKRSLLDPGYIDFLACFQLADKKFLSVFSGIMVSAVKDHPEFRMSLYGDPSKRDFLFWLTAQIYHDLVTAKELEPRQFRNQGSADRKDVTKASEVSTPIEWIYIPRTVRGRPQEVRRPANQKRSATPHRVSGHKRRGNLTETHRTTLEEFENETGIEILRWLPEGYTFVRPHISPVDESQAIQGLPKFIRRRIQDDIRQLLVSQDDSLNT